MPLEHSKKNNYIFPLCKQNKNQYGHYNSTHEGIIVLKSVLYNEKKKYCDNLHMVS